jgi:predicted nucleotidyltransferase component of viral defense system
MIGRGEITKQAQSDQVDAQTAERDYVLAHVAVEISAGAGERMVLKGGTSLRLAHYDNYRYSADLDYSLLGIAADEAFDLIAEALGRCRDRIGSDILELDTNASPPRIRYVGPLAAKPRSIKVDLADDELVIEHRSTPLVVAWRDLPEAATIRCYTLTEICAEKLRCAIQRRQCRDVYDLWTILHDRGGADLFEAWHRFERKAEHKGLDPRRFFDRWEAGLDWYRVRWSAELTDYLGNDCPDFNMVSRALSHHVTRVRDYLVD